MSPTGEPGQTEAQALIGAGRRLRRSSVVVSPLAFGGAAIGGLYEAVSEEQAQSTVSRALEVGLRYLDTAPHYGLGLSERRLGRALRGRPRDSYVLSTKVGRRLEPLGPGETVSPEGFATSAPLKRVWDFSRDGILRSMQESLERLGVDRIDILYLHDPDAFEPDVYATAYPALAELRAAGVVGAIGVGMNQAEMLTRLVCRLDLDLVLVAGRYTLLEQSALDELLPACLERGVGVIAAAPFHGGVLAGPEPGALYNYRPAPPGLVRRATRMQAVCARHGVPLTAAALQFALGHPAVISVLVGARSVQEVDENARAFTTAIPPDAWDELKAERLLGAELPVPRP
ncbi:MAG: aldo/keto reductase [Solirubrobacteraceae bacterium]